ncbi:DUF2723 domain-containing protein [bacterium]|nr:DUF2723 domain-containing protein [bacterium]
MIDTQYLRWNRILAGVVFLFSFIIYFTTMAPTVSFWDCGEFIATSYSLGVPHPPGSPLFLIIGRLFSMLPLSSDIAFRVNLISPIISALANMLLYLIIVKVVVHWRKSVSNINDVIVVFGGALVGALAFAFTDSHWFNAVEAEVYAMSTFFTAIVVWLILHWSERAEEKGNERYILIIAYMVGLAIGVHLLNLLALPFIALVIYFRKQEFEWKSFIITILLTGITFLVIHNGIIQGLPRLAGSAGIFAVILIVIALVVAMIWAILSHKQILSIIFTSFVLIVIGYSTYTMVFIRSNQNPSIDVGEPNTTQSAIAYLEREQYGQVSQLPRKYDGLPAKYEVVGRPAFGQDFSSRQNQTYRFYNIGKQWQFFVGYQIKKMYWRYFLWQFAGRGPSTDSGVTAFGANINQDGVKWTQFGLPLAFILGLGGMFYHFQRDKKAAFSVLTLFFITGLAVIMYLNQDNPQPRERDYSYVGSFLAFSIWIGIGTAAIAEKTIKYIKEKELATRLAGTAIILQILLIPGVMLLTNYHEHNRSGNYVAWDMAYNMLQSCEPNAIIFTNGDNDTYPLWYLQEVESIRKDVTVANLSLLNTPWHIKQLRDSRPIEERFINLTDAQIDELSYGLQAWQEQKVRIPAKNDVLNPDGYIEWNLKPTYAGQALKTQDLMVLRIINDTKWRFPIYFAVTVGNENRIGLEDYLGMEGLTFRLNSHKISLVNKEKMEANLMTDIGEVTWSKEFIPSSLVKDKTDSNKTSWSRDFQTGYMFRNLGNENVYYNDSVIRLMQNYRSGYLQLAVVYYFEYQDMLNDPSSRSEKIETARQKVLKVLQKMDQNLPQKTIPITTNDHAFQIGHLYSRIGEKDIFKSILEDLNSRKNVSVEEKIKFGQAYIQELNDFESALAIFKGLYDSYLDVENLVRTKGIKKAGLTQASWDRWQRLYAEIVSSLVLTYRSLELWEPMESVLNDWLVRNPNDFNAKEMLGEVRRNIGNIDSVEEVSIFN